MVSFRSVRYVLCIISIYTSRLEGVVTIILFFFVAQVSWSSVALSDGASTPSKSVEPKQLT